MKIPQKSKKLYILSASVVGVVLVAALAYLYLSKPHHTEGEQKGNDFGKVDYSPATSADKDYNDKIKNNLGNQASSDNDLPQGTKQDVTVTIVDAKQYDDIIEVRSFINEIIESNGSCVFTFTLNGKTVVRQTEARAEAQTTVCTNLELPSSDFPEKGTWRLSVKYLSETAEGKSEDKDIVVR